MTPGFISVLSGSDFVMGVIDSPLQLSLKKLLLYFSIPYIVFLGPQISCVQYYIMEFFYYSQSWMNEKWKYGSFKVFEEDRGILIFQYDCLYILYK